MMIVAAQDIRILPSIDGLLSNFTEVLVACPFEEAYRAIREFRDGDEKSAVAVFFDPLDQKQTTLAFQLITMLRLDPATRDIMIVLFTADYEGLDEDEAEVSGIFATEDEIGPLGLSKN